MFGRKSPLVEWVLDARWWSDRPGSFRARVSESVMSSYWGNIDSRRLARAYVALAFAQDVAKGYVKENESAHPILSALEMSAKLLEEILGRRVAGG